MPSDFLDSEFTIIGKDGFVGSTLMKGLPGANGFGSKDSHLAPSMPHGNVVICGARGSKFAANQDPRKDALEIAELFLTVSDLRRYKRIILVSTIDVYGSKHSRHEGDIRDAETHYGIHRRELEDLLLDRFDDKLFIVRLPSIFGPGMKKNLLFDLINRRPIGPINIASEQQWYDMRDFSSDLIFMIRSGYKELNLFTEPMTNGELLSMFAGIQHEVIFDPKAAKMYDHRTTSTKSGYWQSKEAVSSKIMDFIKPGQTE